MRRYKFRILILAVSFCVAIGAWGYLWPLTIDGYTDHVSYSSGDTQFVYLSGSRPSSPRYLKLYDGRGRAVDSILAKVPVQYAQGDFPWRDGFGYTKTFGYALDYLKSGIYTWENVAPFVIKSKHDSCDIVVVYPSNTIAAYNISGGKSLYLESITLALKTAVSRLVAFEWSPLIPDRADNRAHTVTFERPGNTTQWEYFQPFLRWITGQNNYKINYIADQDLDDFSSIASARLLIIMGHSEYWTRAARRNFDRFVNGGGNALILSGNTMWWQVRYSPDYSKLICYKSAEQDPVTDPGIKTIEWIDGSLSYPIWKSIGAQFDLGGYGMHEDEGWDGYKIISPQSPLLDGVPLRDSIISIPTLEYDGSFAELSNRQQPRLNKKHLGFLRAELIGFDYGSRMGNKTVSTFLAFQKNSGSGVIINTASMNWCSTTGFGGEDSMAVRIITQNAIEKLLAGETVFAD